MSWLFKLHLSSNEYFVNKIKMIKKKKKEQCPGGHFAFGLIIAGISCQAPMWTLKPLASVPMVSASVKKHEVPMQHRKISPAEQMLIE
jgi:hypothetical protein